MERYHYGRKLRAGVPELVTRWRRLAIEGDLLLYNACGKQRKQFMGIHPLPGGIVVIEAGLLLERMHVFLHAKAKRQLLKLSGDVGRQRWFFVFIWHIGNNEKTGPSTRFFKGFMSIGLSS